MVTIEISDLDPFLAELLRQIPASTDPEGVPAAEQRLFMPPADAGEKEILPEWKTLCRTGVAAAISIGHRNGG